MDSDFKWMAAVVAVIFGGLFGSLGYNEHLRHAEKMECIKAKGEYIKETCVFR